MSTQTTTEHFYSPPKAGLEHDGIVAAGVSAGMLEQLDGTSGWVRLIGVLSLLAALATAFGAVAMLFIGTLSGDIPGGDPSAALEAGVVGANRGVLRPDGPRLRLDGRPAVPLRLGDPARGGQS